MNDIIKPKKIFEHKPHSLTVLHDATKHLVVLQAWPTVCGGEIGEKLCDDEYISILVGVLSERGYAKAIRRDGFKEFGRKKNVFFFRDDDSQEVFEFHMDHDERVALALMLMPIVDPEIAHQNMMVGKS